MVKKSLEKEALSRRYRSVIRLVWFQNCGNMCAKRDGKKTDERYNAVCI